MSQSFFNKQKNKSIPLLDRKSTIVHNEICKKNFKKYRRIPNVISFTHLNLGYKISFLQIRKQNVCDGKVNTVICHGKPQTLVAWWFLLMYATTTLYPTKIYCKLKPKGEEKVREIKHTWIITARIYDCMNCTCIPLIHVDTKDTFILLKTNKINW